MKNTGNWAPRAAPATLRARAVLYAAIRRFFAARGVLEVDTPILSAAATVDPHIESFATRDGRWLQASPEFAMKRLLAGGAPAIYQIARVFRCEEQGRHHNPEFTLLEWYRPGWDYRALMDEVAELIRACGVEASGLTHLTYREAFMRHAGLDPFLAALSELRACCRAHFADAPEPEAGPEPVQRDFFLDLLMSAAVAPQLGHEAPVFIRDFPASQAALARLRDGQPPVAERFELFWKGLELANGFTELTDSVEQQRRFEDDQARRRARGEVPPPYDTQLIAAIEAGLPGCAGVALGLDRLLMLLLDLPELGDALAFDSERA